MGSCLAKQPVEPAAPEKDEAVVDALSRALRSMLFKDKTVSESTREGMIAVAVRSMVHRVVPSGTPVLVQGMLENRQFGFVAKGELDVIIDGKPTGRQIQAGQGFGELSLLYHEPISATVTAKCDTCLWSLSREDFDRIQASDTARCQLTHLA